LVLARAISEAKPPSAPGGKLLPEAVMKTIALELPESLDQELEAMAERRGVSKSNLVREAVEGYLSSATSEPEPGSFLDRARDLVGRLDGPADLSSNKEYLAGLGK
jgi:Arc/MetJ-type ribon-helix-helix transcriptional regulator